MGQSAMQSTSTRGVANAALCPTFRGIRFLYTVSPAGHGPLFAIIILIPFPGQLSKAN